MKKATEYYQHAQECRQLAGRTADADHKATLLTMAETWEALAHNREDHVARRQRIETLDGRSDEIRHPLLGVTFGHHCDVPSSNTPNKIAVRLRQIVQRETNQIPRGLDMGSRRFVEELVARDVIGAAARSLRPH